MNSSMCECRRKGKRLNPTHKALQSICKLDASAGPEIVRSDEAEADAEDQGPRM